MANIQNSLNVHGKVKSGANGFETSLVTCCADLQAKLIMKKSNPRQLLRLVPDFEVEAVYAVPPVHCHFFVELCGPSSRIHSFCHFFRLQAVIIILK